MKTTLHCQQQVLGYICILQILKLAFHQNNKKILEFHDNLKFDLYGVKWSLLNL